MLTNNIHLQTYTHSQIKAKTPKRVLLLPFGEYTNWLPCSLAQCRNGEEAWYHNICNV